MGRVLYRQPKNTIWRGLDDFTWLLVWKYGENNVICTFWEKNGGYDVIELGDGGRIISKNGLKNEIVIFYLKLIQLTSNLHRCRVLRKGMVQDKKVWHPTRWRHDDVISNSDDLKCWRKHISWWRRWSKCVFLNRRFQNIKNDGSIIIGWRFVAKL